MFYERIQYLLILGSKLSGCKSIRANQKAEAKKWPEKSLSINVSYHQISNISEAIIKKE
jgi:hypothetical protein